MVSEDLHLKFTTRSSLRFQSIHSEDSLSFYFKMGSTVLPYMETKPKVIFFTDFDGTITVDDSKPRWEDGGS